VIFFKLAIGLAIESYLGRFGGCEGILLFSTRGENGAGRRRAEVPLPMDYGVDTSLRADPIVMA
jgi:hypothetical protein